jgi:ABC-type enterobactin transport system permease subunit
MHLNRNKSDKNKYKDNQEVEKGFLGIKIRLVSASSRAHEARIQHMDGALTNAVKCWSQLWNSGWVDEPQFERVNSSENVSSILKGQAKSKANGITELGDETILEKVILTRKACTRDIAFAVSKQSADVSAVGAAVLVALVKPPVCAVNGGLTYAWPGAKPASRLRKYTCHDCQRNIAQA